MPHILCQVLHRAAFFTVELDEALSIFILLQDCCRKNAFKPKGLSASELPSRLEQAPPGLRCFSRVQQQAFNLSACGQVGMNSSLKDCCHIPE